MLTNFEEAWFNPEEVESIGLDVNHQTDQYDVVLNMKSGNSLKVVSIPRQRDVPTEQVNKIKHALKIHINKVCREFKGHR